MTTARLLVVCPDRPGIVAAIATRLYERGANIVHIAEPQDPPLHFDQTVIGGRFT